MRTQNRNLQKLAGVLVSLLGAAAAVEAAPIQYNFTSGLATLSLTSGGQSLLAAPGTVALTGTQVTIDTAALQLNSFQFVAAGPSILPGAGALGTTTLTLTNLDIIPGPAYSTLSMTGGPTNYNYLVSPVTVSGTYALSGGINQVATNFSSTNPSLTGAINLSGAPFLTLNGITLGLFTLPTALGGGTATLKVDVVFNGVVPVPAAVWLFGSSLGLMGVMRRRVV